MYQKTRPDAKFLMAYSNSAFKVLLKNFYFVFGKEKKFIFVVI